MGPVGNDLVWLGDPANQNRHRDPRLLDRILGPAERRFVETARDPHRVLWSLWAAKEAAYKAWVRGHTGAVFSPVTFAVTLGTQPVVLHQGEALPVAWAYGEGWVHALAGEAPDGVRTVVTSSITDDASEAVRSLAVDAFRRAGWPHGTIQDRPPRFILNDQVTDLAFSLSHDGPFLAVAFRMGACRKPGKTL